MWFSDAGHAWLILFCVGLSTLLIGYPLLSLRRARRAAAWPTAPATLEAAEVCLAPGSQSSPRGWGVEVRYAYEVNGAAYEGRRLAFGYVPGGDKSAAEAIVEQLRGARALRVRYDPHDPSRSTLSVGAPHSIAYLLVLGGTVAYFFAVVIAAILLEEGVFPTAVRPVALAAALAILPVFAVAFFLLWRASRGMERSVALNLITD